MVQTVLAGWGKTLINEALQLSRGSFAEKEELSAKIYPIGFATATSIPGKLTGIEGWKSVRIDTGTLLKESGGKLLISKSTLEALLIGS